MKYSIYAFNQVINTRNKFRKLLWATVLIISLVGSTTEIVRFLKLYLEYPFVVSLKIEREKTLIFPAVTICNQNPVKLSYKKCLNVQVTTRDCQRSLTKLSPLLEQASKQKGFYSCTNGFSGFYGERQAETTNFFTLYTKMGRKKRKLIGHELFEMIHRCSFDGHECSYENFTLHQDMMYGNCYTFNKASGGVGRDLPTVIGHSKGLEVLLFLNPSEYMFEIPAIGARVFIHKPHENPDMEENAVTVKPGYETSIGLSEFSIRRLPFPYKDNCVDYSQRIGLQSNYAECVKQRLQQYLFEKCHCIEIGMFYIKHMRYCDKNNASELCCLDKALKSFSKVEDSCHCSLPCNFVGYKRQISTAKWPSVASFVRNFHDIQWMDFNSKDGGAYFNHNRKMMSDEKRGYAIVKVFYLTPDRLVYEQKPKLDDFKFYSFLGGELGFWFGVSLAVLFELIESLTNFMKSFIQKFYLKSKNSSVKQVLCQRDNKTGEKLYQH